MLVWVCCHGCFAVLIKVFWMPKDDKFPVEGTKSHRDRQRLLSIFPGALVVYDAVEVTDRWR